MSPNSPPVLWRINVWSFWALALLAATGLLQWLSPHGAGSAAGLRHLLRWVHQAAALAFLALIGLHLWRHADYIRRHLQRHGLFGRKTP
jgi:membrane protein implicated in regulation of membrane protease activity